MCVSAAGPSIVYCLKKTDTEMIARHFLSLGVRCAPPSAVRVYVCMWVYVCMCVYTYIIGLIC